MKSREEKLAWLGDLLDKIGPGVRLQIDDNIVKAIFETGFREAVTYAMAFAEEHECSCIHRDGETSALFIRAYFKDDVT